MEDTLRDERESVQDAREVVLILVLMEDTLRAIVPKVKLKGVAS